MALGIDVDKIIKPFLERFDALILLIKETNNRLDDIEDVLIEIRKNQ